MKKIQVGIIGGAGYTGGETIRLLLNHPQAELVFVHSRSNAGNPLHTSHPDLIGDTKLTFTDTIEQNVDVIFLCLGHGESKKFLTENPINASVKIIDLSQDFRLGEQVEGREFVYGLPEVNREAIKKASNIANPGCFATAIQLGLAPLAKVGWLGAGQKLQDTTHFTWRANNISAYKTLTHQHIKEITKTIGQLQTGYSKSINFIPWRGDFTRGIYVSSCITIKASLVEVEKLFHDFYKTHPFTILSHEMIDLKQVVNTNKALIALEKEGDKLVVHSAIDNLLKGASGQAVQNMNLMFGLEESAGLKLKSIVF